MMPRHCPHRLPFLKALSVACLGAALAWLAPDTAHAQYKNSAFGLDLGGWLLTKPSVVDPDAPDGVLPVDKRPIRLANGLRLGGESNFKMSEDHWWFTARVNLGLLRYRTSEDTSVNAQFDNAAADALGTLMGVQGSIGVRYVFLTDRLRPYLQGAMSYMHVFSFANAATSDCVDAVVCSDAGTKNIDAFLPHNDVGAFHVQPGVEMVFTRDIALHLFADVQRWIVINAEDNVAVVVGLGLVFFT